MSTNADSTRNTTAGSAFDGPATSVGGSVALDLLNDDPVVLRDLRSILMPRDVATERARKAVNGASGLGQGRSHRGDADHRQNLGVRELSRSKRDGLSLDFADQVTSPPLGSGS